MTITPARKFHGRFRLPGDKSISHRAAILAALAEGRSRLSNFASAADCASTLACLRALGVAVEHAGSEVTIEGRGLAGLCAPEAPLDAGNSGSTLRMLAGVAATRPFRSVLTGDASLRRRPVERVAAPLRAMGARLESSDGRPPLAVFGGALHGVEWRPEVASAQVKTAVLLAGLGASGETSVVEPQPTRDHTERLLPVFGVPVLRGGARVGVRGGSRLSPASFAVPGDASSAAFLVVAALLLPDSEVVLEDVLLNPGRLAFLEVLREMGADIRVEATGERAGEAVGRIQARSSRLRGVAIPEALVPALIDEVPALAAAACAAEGVFSLSGARELRVKESDRIAALAEGLAALGAAVEERPDGLRIEGGRRLRGALLRSHGDHRIAMALSVLALTAEGPSEIEGAACAAVSFPEFFDVLEQGTGRSAAAGAAPARIVLVGFMGAGKTTIGRALARRLGWDFLDLDAGIEAEAGISLVRLFEREGEAAFRARELRAARAASAAGSCVIAAGGGAWAQPDTREALQSGARSVWLRAPLDALMARLPADGRRPLAGNRETMRALLTEREPSYRLADVVVDADAPPAAVVGRIVEALELGAGSAQRR
ncbi:MAG: 3-phosphoshikimate 1-carboxyvinyltransferase [Vicinamibacteria bacterium]